MAENTQPTDTPVVDSSTDITTPETPAPGTPETPVDPSTSTDITTPETPAPETPETPVDPSTSAGKPSGYVRTESWWHPGSIGDVSQGLINGIFKVMPYKNKNLSWEDA